MSLASVSAFFAKEAPDVAIIQQAASTATVAEAAATLGVEPGRIAKTLSLRVKDRVVLVVTRGDARIDNRKTKAALGDRPRMLGADEVEAITGHPVGGVCPFGLATPLPIYCDVSLKAFDRVYPAAGSRTASVCLAPDRLAALTGAQWIDICQAVEEPA
ncbi:YbaK/EbsC family protein [Flavisphingomonas formosensis]|uniref:YbaK/EbsC family protein n=1 Tax=Flavisphingomonas formosensis TaxID=861534 RepID=UPI0012F7418B|nr:YbaK/EbsC family protein [Sphingomonas formosensis]